VKEFEGKTLASMKWNKVALQRAQNGEGKGAVLGLGIELGLSYWAGGYVGVKGMPDAAIEAEAILTATWMLKTMSTATKCIYKHTHTVCQVIVLTKWKMHKFWFVSIKY